MDKKIELLQEILVIGDSRVNVGRYTNVRIGNYTPAEIERRREHRIDEQLHKEKLFVTEETWEEFKKLKEDREFEKSTSRKVLSKLRLVHSRVDELQSKINELEKGMEEIRIKYYERLRELETEIKPDLYSKCMMLVYHNSEHIDFDNLQVRVTQAIPTIMKDSVRVEVHYSGSPAGIFNEATIPSHHMIPYTPHKNGLEIMVTEDVELGVRF